MSLCLQYAHGGFPRWLSCAQSRPPTSRSAPRAIDTHTRITGGASAYRDPRRTLYRDARSTLQVEPLATLACALSQTRRLIAYPAGVPPPRTSASPTMCLLDFVSALTFGYGTRTGGLEGAAWSDRVSIASGPPAAINSARVPLTLSRNVGCYVAVAHILCTFQSMNGWAPNSLQSDRDAAPTMLSASAPTLCRAAPGQGVRPNSPAPHPQPQPQVSVSVALTDRLMRVDRDRGSVLRIAFRVPSPAPPGKTRHTPGVTPRASKQGVKVPGSGSLREACQCARCTVHRSPSRPRPRLAGGTTFPFRARAVVHRSNRKPNGRASPGSGGAEGSGADDALGRSLQRTCRQ
ncbi:hypothetical protein DAEQUDRAFT_179215 [Daedalea quercina L-15889]|uniref:Uncharacterized protein n=1 Tax=Daedalea quercina L-15889 TaxID=1314783 RepID=A0A165RE52_9APHY|nr:hypothetical protein DAEQUDRAFT_179215 [Daedalea quercina L-15889]